MYIYIYIYTHHFYGHHRRIYPLGYNNYIPHCTINAPIWVSVIISIALNNKHFWHALFWEAFNQDAYSSVSSKATSGIAGVGGEVEVLAIVVGSC